MWEKLNISLFLLGSSMKLFFAIFCDQMNRAKTAYEETQFVDEGMMYV